MVRRLIPLMLMLSGAAVAQPPTTVIDITLASFKFAPETIRLHHGQRYVLKLTNNAGGGHDFTAERFFASAQLAAGAPVRKGSVELDGHETVSVTLTAPAAGTYPVRCSHFLHTAFGMKGNIVVD